MRGYKFILFLVVFACNKHPKSMDSDDYIQWYNSENCQAKIKKELGEYTFVSEYRPIEYMTLTELRRLDLPLESFDSVSKDFEGMHYFILKVKTQDLSKDMLNYNLQNQQQYYDRVQYFSELASSDFILIENNDTIPCAMYHFERTYNTSAYNNILVAFPIKSAQVKSSLQLQFNDQMLGNGRLIFSYSQSLISQLPTLKL